MKKLLVATTLWVIVTGFAVAQTYEDPRVTEYAALLEEAKRMQANIDAARAKRGLPPDHWVTPGPSLDEFRVMLKQADQQKGR